MDPVRAPHEAQSTSKLHLTPYAPLRFVLSSDDLILPCIPQNVEVLDAALIRQAEGSLKGNTGVFLTRTSLDRLILGLAVEP